MENLQGIIVPIITPFTQNEDIDIAGLDRLIDHLLQGGINSIFMFSTSGEYPRLCDSQKNILLEKTMAKCANKMDVFVGITDTSRKKVYENLKIAEEVGASAAILSPTYYYKISDKEMELFFLNIAEKSSIPVVLYDIPSSIGVSISENVTKAVYKHPNIAGIKDSCGDMQKLEMLIKKYSSDDFKVLVGPEELAFEGLEKGASGLVPSLANVFPKLFSEFFRAMKNKDFKQGRALFDVIDEFNHMSLFNESSLHPIEIRKEALSILGICQPWLTAPYLRDEKTTRELVGKFIEKHSSVLGL